MSGREQAGSPGRTGTQASSGRRIKIWLLELRAPFFTAAIVPVLFGGAFTWWAEGVYDFDLLLLTMAGTVALHAGTNMINDYFDFKSGGDIINRARTPFSGGSPFLVEGVLGPREVYLAAMISFGIGGAIGLYLAWAISWWILPVGLAGGLLGFSYVAPRVNLAALGVGEIAVGLGFGPLITFGTYMVLTGEVGLDSFVVGIPIGLLIGLVLYVNQFPDMEADASVGKKHWVVRLGRKRASVGYLVVIGSAYVATAFFALVAVLPATALLFLLTLPIAIRASRIVLANPDNVRALLPAQAMTIQIHLFGGLLLSVGTALAVYVF